MKKIFFTLLLSVAFLFALNLGSKVEAAYFTPIGGSSVLDFGDVSYNLDTGNFSRNNMVKSINFTNDRDDTSSGVDTTVRTIGVYNSFADNYVYNGKLYTAGSPFKVYSPDLGYSANKYMSIDTYLPSGEVGSVSVRFSGTTAHIQHCIDARERTCDFGNFLDTRRGEIYYQPYYCLTTAPTSCMVSDGLQVQPYVDIKFLLPKPELSVTELDFNDVEVGTSKSLSFEIRNNTSDLDFQFVFPNNQGDFSSSNAGQSSSISLNSSKTYTITYTPSEEGSVSKTYYFTDSRVNVSKILGLEASLAVVGNGYVEEAVQEPIENSDSTETEVDPETSDNEDSSEAEQASTSDDSGSDISKSETIQETESNSKTTYQSNRDSELEIEMEIENVETESEEQVEMFDYDTETKSLSISGLGKPNTNYVIYVYSDPIIFSVRTDDNGIWSIELKEDIKPGNHEVFMAEADDEDSLLEDPKLISKVSITDVSSVIDIDDGQVKNQNDIYYVIFGVVGVLILLVVSFFSYKNIKRKKEASKVSL